MEGKSLIVYYSWVGNTHVVAEEMARQTGFSLVRLEERRPRPFEKYIAASFGAMLGLRSRLRPIDWKLAGVGTVYLGAQVWAGHSTQAINAFLAKADLRGKRVRLFLTRADETTQQKVIDSIARRVRVRGGTFVDCLGLTAPWDPKDVKILAPETIRDDVSAWLGAEAQKGATP